MAVPPDISARLERLLSGTRRVEDLYRIFGWARFQTRGRAPLVKDIGDFVAHRDQRDAGITWERGREFSNAMSIFIKTNDKPTPGKVIQEAAMDHLKNRGPLHCKKNLGISYKKAQNLLISGTNKIVSIGKNWTPVLKQPMTQEEYKVFSQYGLAFEANYAFSIDDLIGEMTNFFYEHKLIAKKDGSLFNGAYSFIAAFVISITHGTELYKNKQPLAKLRLNVREEFAKIDIIRPLENGGKFIMCIIDTKLVATEYCSHKLLDRVDDLENYMLEVNDFGQLDIL